MGRMLEEVIAALPQAASRSRRGSVSGIERRGRELGRVASGKAQVEIASALEPPEQPGAIGNFGTHPHASFSSDGSLWTYTATALGRLDVAVAPVRGICECANRTGSAVAERP